MLLFHNRINNDPSKVAFGTNMLFLLISRPVFVFGFVLMILPLVLCNSFVKPLIRILGHEYWTPLARLVYGVFLINTVFM